MAAEWEEAEPKKRSHLRLFISLVTLALLVGVFAALKSGLLSVFLVISGSMEPTLQIGDRILIDTGEYPRSFDIIAFQDPNSEDSKEKVVKRIVGTPGDLVEIRSGILYINGKLQYSEKISGNRINWDDVRVKVPSGHFFVLGDNRNDSYDSLNFGPLPEENVVGVLSMILWPPSRWGKVPRFKD